MLALIICSDGFCGGRKTEEPGKKPSEQRQESTINLQTLMCMTPEVRESNPTQATPVGGEHSHQCGISAPPPIILSSHHANTMINCFSFPLVSVRVDIRARKIFSCNLGPIFTVEEILASTTDDFKPLKEFILKGYGK